MHGLHRITAVAQVSRVRPVKGDDWTLTAQMPGEQDFMESQPSSNGAVLGLLRDSMLVKE